MKFATTSAVQPRGLACLVLLASLAACGESSKPKPTPDASTRAPSEGDDEDAGEGERDPCKGAELGSACGTDLFCIRGQCVVNTCGDGVEADGEDCDDGNVANGDGCDASCKEEPKGCGNAELDKGEECDDGNRIDDDACSNACTKNECGNMRVDVNEECDDGNEVNDDKCSNKCLIVRCRNGRVDPGEQCDDGNQVDNDGCTNKCRIMICGNGKTEEKEECDDGNNVDDDACSNRCTANVCGNMRVDPGEDCDGTANCSDKCKMQADKCTPCEIAHCSDYMGTGLDLVKGCKQGMAFDLYPDLFADKPRPNTDEFIAQCSAVLSCAQTTSCVESRMGGVNPSACYCGAASPDECTQNGPSQTPPAPCLKEWQEATYTTSNVDVIARITDFAFPAGWANFLLTCDYENCKDECLPGTP